VCSIWHWTLSLYVVMWCDRSHNCQVILLGSWRFGSTIGVVAHGKTCDICHIYFDTVTFRISNFMRHERDNLISVWNSYKSQGSQQSWNFKVVLKLSWILKLSWNFSQWLQMLWYWPLFGPIMWLFNVLVATLIFSDCPILWDCDNSLFLVLPLI